MASEASAMGRRATDVSVREAAGADAAAVWPLAETLATSFAPTRAAFECSFAAVLHDPAAAVFVAGADGTVVGYLLCVLHPTFFADAPVGWIEELMVAPAERRRGIGRLLMAAAESWARGGGAAYIALATRRAAAFYSAIGYEDSATFFRKML
jgi:GNAT superfamily N-acetyltransferase